MWTPDNTTGLFSTTPSKVENRVLGGRDALDYGCEMVIDGDFRSWESQEIPR